MAKTKDSRPAKQFAGKQRPTLPSSGRSPAGARQSMGGLATIDGIEQLKAEALATGISPRQIAALERQAERVAYTHGFYEPSIMFYLVVAAAARNCQDIGEPLMAAAAWDDRDSNPVHDTDQTLQLLPRPQLEQLRDNLDFLLLLIDAEERERRSRPGEDGVRRCVWCGAVRGRLGKSGCCMSTSLHRSKCAANYRQNRKRIKDYIKDGFSSFSGGRQTLGEATAVTVRELLRFSLAVTISDARKAGARARRTKGGKA